MKNEKNRRVLVILGAIILGVFISISLINLAGTGDYYLSTDIIKKIEYNDGKLIITPRYDMVSVCVKETKSEPTYDSLCWEDKIDDKVVISIYEYKTYYIWTKNIDDVVTYYTKYNSKNNK